MSALIIKPILQALVEHADLIDASMIDSSTITSGMFIYVPENMLVENQIYLTHNQATLNICNIIILNKNSQATIIEDYCNDFSCKENTNSNTKIQLQAHAKLIHYKIQREDQQVSHVGHIVANQAESSQLFSHLMSTGAKHARNDITIYLQGKHAECNLNGLYMPLDSQRMDQRTVVHHEVAECTSEQDYKGILNDSSRASFDGLVVVNQFAEKTVAKQQNKNLLLSKTAEVYTKPQLEIYADDVVCTHGATVGQLDEDAIFYFATRGIDKNIAEDYLVQAFIANNLNAMPKL